MGKRTGIGKTIQKKGKTLDERKAGWPFAATDSNE